jgi:hypothetical protein
METSLVACYNKDEYNKNNPSPAQIHLAHQNQNGLDDLPWLKL